MSNSLWPHGLQHITLPVLHCLLKLMSIDAIQPSHPLSPPSPPAFILSQQQGLFPMNRLFASGGQSIVTSASASVLPINIQGWSFSYTLLFLKIFLCGPFFKSFSNLLQYCFCFMFWLFGHEACGILAHRPGTKPAASPTVEISTTGPTGKSHPTLLLFSFLSLCHFLCFYLACCIYLPKQPHSF